MPLGITCCILHVRVSVHTCVCVCVCVCMCTCTHFCIITTVLKSFSKSMFITIISFVSPIIFYNFNNNVMCVLIISTPVLKSNILLFKLPEASACSVTLLPSLLTQVNSHLLSYPLVTHSRAIIKQQPQRGMGN